MKQRKFYGTILAVAMLIVVFSSVGWAQPARLTQALPPAQTDPVGVTVTVTGPATVTVGSTFEVQVEATNIPDPGIFGYQFALNWDSAVISPVSGTLSLNPDFPVTAKKEVGDGVLEVATSREGAVDDLTGPLTLLTWTFQANAATDPDFTTLSLTDVKLGRKGGVDVPVETLVDLDVVVVEEPVGASISGNAKVEGRADDNQAGHEVVAVGSSATLSTTTNLDGGFLFDNASADTYDVTADSAGFLAATCEDVVHGVDPTVLNDVVLLAGDINDDDLIDITDAVAIGAAFGSADAVADLNDDGVVDVLDLILMAVNFDQTSLANPWVCQ